ncbi:outer membrane beta-barrel protein [Psychroflexus montanilacus]|uniref:outer membrane beta-barrel protein n=1 Tax=Psychroflexus montanilacus TaxID=2873598 RepID=UPI001CCC3284|nr:outer membrane beta-barrel protein [Psychroflexus montanilacus]MBZ9650903.1 outer membrane beta-barrel protein [Psychroflexus montanilacus]
MKKIITFCVIVLLGANSQAQMKDVTVTLQPTASYNWFDNNAAIEDGLMYGGRVGFGFGEAIELRAVYEKSADLKNTVDGFDAFSDDFVNNFTSRSVDIERVGGEFKANIPTRGTFVPYLTVGAGVQTLEFDISEVGEPSNDQKLKQIYGNLGLGTQIKLSDRLFFNLEVKNTVFNLNPASVLFQEGQDPSEFEDLLGDDNNSRMYNWSVLAGLQLYLGGRSPEDYSDLDRAYYNKYSGGLSGFKLIVEPVGAFVNFDSDSNFANSYFIGGKVGFDLNQYVGIRGFYYQATKNEEISTDWDNLAIYGADFVAKLNVSRGLVPYITVGGGYLNAYNSYTGNDGINGATSSFFAKGGLGLNIPLTRNLEAFGDASLLYTSERGTSDLQNTVTPEELRQHVMYTVGLRFQLGKKADDTDEILESKIDRQVENRTQAYQNRIDELESELSEAYKNNDTRKAVKIIEEKKELERIQKSDPKMKSFEEKGIQESKVEMTPKELEELIEKVIQGVDKESRRPQTIEDRMDRLERLLLELNTGVYNQNLAPVRQEDASQKVMDMLKELDRKIDDNADRIREMQGSLENQNQNQGKTTVITSGQQTPTSTLSTAQPSKTTVQTDKDDNTIIQTENASGGVASGLVINEGLSLFTGVAVANDASMIIGVRGNYAFTNSPFKFMPDFYLAPGKNTGFGINANVVIPFNIDSGVILNPYAGLGLGYNDVAGESTFSPNLILGTSFNVLGGQLFADYTAHNFIDIHRISVGYKFKF